jgi:TorA maturation chaperone TorD
MRSRDHERARDQMNKESGTAIADTLAYRHSFYDLLRRIFLWEIPPELFIELVEAAKGEQEPIDSACSHEVALKKSLREVSANDLPAIYQELQIEYTRLFLGPRHRPAPPYESVYRSPQKLMMQDVTMEVRSFYAKHGFEVARLNQEPDDTIGFELEFMCALSGATMKAYIENDRAQLGRLVSTQREFCDLHLNQWIPQFCEDIITNTHSDIWKSIAICTRSFIEQDAADLNRLANEMPAECKLDTNNPACRVAANSPGGM